MRKQVITLFAMMLVVISQVQAQQLEPVKATDPVPPVPVTSESGQNGPPVNQPIKGQIVKVPRRAGLKFLTLQPLSSETAAVGDEIPLQLERPLIINNTVVLPAGQVVKAKVTKVRKAQKCKDGEVQWKLDRLPFPDSSTAKTQIWSMSPGPTLQVPARLYQESTGDDLGLDFPEINEWWEAPLAFPMWALTVAVASPLLALFGVVIFFQSFDDTCVVPGKEFVLPTNSSVAVMITEAHQVRF